MAQPSETSLTDFFGQVEGVGGCAAGFVRDALRPVIRATIHLTVCTIYFPLYLLGQAAPTVHVWLHGVVQYSVGCSLEMYNENNNGYFCTVLFSIFE